MFLHVTHVWEKVDMEEYTVTHAAMQAALTDTLRHRGDMTMDLDGVVRQVGKLEISTAPFHGGRYLILISNQCTEGTGSLLIDI